MATYISLLAADGELGIDRVSLALPRGTVVNTPVADRAE